MLRILGFAAIVALLCLGAVGATPAPTGAERIQASVSKTLNFSELGAAGVGTIETYLAGALIDLSGPGNASYNAAWKCVKLAGGEPGSFGVQVQAGVLQGPYDRNLPQFHDTHVTLATTGDYALLAALRVSGQGDALFGSPRYVQREEGEDEASFGDRLGRVAAEIVKNLAAQRSPCKVRAKAHALSTVRIGGGSAALPAGDGFSFAASVPAQADGISYTYEWNGDLDLTLQDDGTANTTAPISLIMTMTIPECRSSNLTAVNPKATVGVEYRQNDGGLVLRKMNLSVDNIIGSLTCLSGENSFTCTVDFQRVPNVTCTGASGGGFGGAGVFGGQSVDLASTQELSGTLQDGTSISIPAPANFTSLPSEISWSWDATLTLQYSGSQ